MKNIFRRGMALLLMLVMLSGIIGPGNVMMLTAYAEGEDDETVTELQPGETGVLTETETEAAQEEEPAETPEEQAGPEDAAQTVPSATPEVPEATPEVPAATPEVPAATPELPAATPEVPEATPELPAATPELPADTNVNTAYTAIRITGGEALDFAPAEILAEQITLPEAEGGSLRVAEAWSFLGGDAAELYLALRGAPDLAEGEQLILAGLNYTWKTAAGEPVGGDGKANPDLAFTVDSSRYFSEVGTDFGLNMDSAVTCGFALLIFTPAEETPGADGAADYVFPAAEVKLSDIISALGLELTQNNYNVSVDGGAVALSSDKVNKNSLSGFVLTAGASFEMATLTLESTNGKDKHVVTLSYTAPAVEEPAGPTAIRYEFAGADDYVMLLSLLTQNDIYTVAIDDAAVTEGDESAIELADYIGDYMVLPTAHFDRLVLTVTTREGESYEIVFSYPAKPVRQTITPVLPGEAEMSLTGLMPEDASVETAPVEAAVSGKAALAAYEIDILTPEGEPWQPAEGESITVRLYDPAFTGRLFVYHMADAGAAPEYVGAADAHDGWISFEAKSFSVYAVAGAVSGTIMASDGNTYEITVTYDETAGVPADATLSVSEVAENAAADAAVAAQRAEGMNVALSHTFDIKILDGSGGEIQPAAGSTVTVTFALAELANPNLTAGIYHLRESGGGLTAESLTPSIDGTVATVTTDGFSEYTVEFTYGEKQYVIPGGDPVLLDEVLNAIGIVGTIEDAEVSDSTLFEVNWNKYDDSWYVYSLQEFHSDEWLKVTVDGVVYEIVVTDAFIGDSGGSGHTDFTRGADLATITIEDLSGYFSDNSNFTLNGLVWSGEYFGWNGTLGVNETKSLGASATVKCVGAATTSDHQLCDVIITYSDIVLYGHDTGASTGFHGVGRRGNSLQVTAKTASTFGYGLKVSINVKIVKTGTDDPVDGSYFFTVYDLNLNRTNQSATHIVGYNDNNHYTETVEIDSSIYDIYFVNDSNGKLTNSGNMIYPSANNGGGLSYMTGAAVRVDNTDAGFSLTAYQYAPPKTETNFVLMPRGGINHTITSYSGYGGSIATSTTGKREDIVSGASTYLDGGKVDDQRTYVVPTGKTAIYKMTPESGYTLNGIYVDNDLVAKLDGSGNLIITDQNKLDINKATIMKDGDAYYCAFSDVSKTLKVSVSWKPTNSPPSVSLPVGHIGMDPSGSGVTLVDLTSNVSAEIAARTITLPYPSSPGAAPTPVKVGNTPAPKTITKGSTTYDFSFYGLAQQTFDPNMAGYGASLDLWLRYTEYGQVQFSVDGTNWDNWVDNNNPPRVYAMYGSTSGNYVYITISPTLLGSIVDSTTKIEYTIIKHTDIWNYHVDRGIASSATNGQKITKTDNSTSVYITTTDEGAITTSTTAGTVKLEPGRYIIIPISYQTAAGSFYTSPTAHNDLADANISIDWLEVKETVPNNYDLTDIELENGGSGTKDKTGARYTVYTSGGTYYNNTAYGVPYRTPTAVLTDNDSYLVFYTHYSWTFGPTSPIPTDTEVEFIHQRQTVDVSIQKILDDPSMSSSEKKDFIFTVRARELLSDGEHYANLGNYVIQNVSVANTASNPATVMRKVNDDGSYGATVSSIAVPKGSDVLIIERWLTTEDLYDTTVTNTGTNPIKIYRAADREYMIENIQANTTVTYTNKLKPRIVTVRKVVENGLGTEDFSFLVTLVDANGVPIANHTLFTDDLRRERQTNASGQVDLYLDDGRSVELKVPYGATLMITEQTAGEFNYESWEFTPTSGLLDQFTTKYKVNTGAEVSGRTVTLSSVQDHYTTVLFTNTKPLPAPTGVYSNTKPFGLLFLFGAVFAALPVLGWLKRRRKEDDDPNPGGGNGPGIRCTGGPPSGGTPPGANTGAPPGGKPTVSYSLASLKQKWARGSSCVRSNQTGLTAREVGKRAREKILSQVIQTRIRGWPRSRGDPNRRPRARSGPMPEGG